MKRIALIAAAVVLTACGGAKEEPAAEPAMEEVAPAPAPAVDSAAAPADSAAAPADSTAK